jgi:hypothetical protein
MSCPGGSGRNGCQLYNRPGVVHRDRDCERGRRAPNRRADEIVSRRCLSVTFSPVPRLLIWPTSRLLQGAFQTLCETGRRLKASRLFLFLLNTLIQHWLHLDTNNLQREHWARRCQRSFILLSSHHEHREIQQDMVLRDSECLFIPSVVCFGVALQLPLARYPFISLLASNWHLDFQGMGRAKSAQQRTDCMVGS